MKLLVKLFNGVRKLVGLLLPVFSRAGDFRGWGTGLLWTIHILLLLAVLVALVFLDQRFLKFSPFLKAPAFLRGYWLAILFFLVYLVGLLGWWIYKLWGPEEEESDFPEIDEAWRKAVAALEESGIGLLDAPLFLVLGRPLGGEAAFFGAAEPELVFRVKGAPSSPDAPLHVFAGSEGIFVTCPSISLLGRQAAILAGDDRPAWAGDGPGGDGGGGVGDSMGSITGTVMPGDFERMDVRQAAAILNLCRVEKRDPTAEEELILQRLGKRPRRSLLRQQDDVALLGAQLRHLCRLIVRARHPYCPINGILVLIPLAATEGEDEASQTGTLCRQDLQAAREVFQINCPLLALVCDLETVPGFQAFMGRLDRSYHKRRVGQHFPLVPVLKKMSLADMTAAGARWICEVVFPTWVYRLFEVEGDGPEGLPEVVESNAGLFHLLSQMRERQARLSGVLGLIVPEEEGEPPLLAGCYLAATGREARDQAFIAGIVHRLIKEQNWVSWTARALAEEKNLGRLTFWARIGLGAYAALLVAGLAYWLIF